MAEKKITANLKMKIRGGQASVGYYSDFRYCQEYYGLTDTAIAHSPIRTRGRIGHEKHGTPGYFENKGLNFMFLYHNLSPAAFQHITPMFPDEFRKAEIILPPFHITAEIISYNAELFNRMKNKLGENFRYTDFGLYLDHYVETKMPAATLQQLQSDFDNFNLYYFKWNDDKKREQVFLDALLKKKTN